MTFTPLPHRYLTFTFAGRENCCPGLMHIQRCLHTLLQVAAITQRVALLPPPWLLLHADHNYSPLHDPTQMRRNVDWSRYFDLSTLIDSGKIVMPEFHIHQPIIGSNGAYVLTGTVVTPDTQWHLLRRMNDSLVVLKFQPKWGGSHRETDCHSKAVGGLDVISGSSSSTVNIDVESPLVRKTANAIADRLGWFVVVHIRRGRAITSKSARTRTDGYSYGGCGTANLLRVTSPTFIADVWRQLQPSNRSNGRTTLLVMTNERNRTYHRTLREAIGPELIFDWELSEIRRIHTKLADNYLAFMIGRSLSTRAMHAVGTASCYFRSGCSRLLCDDECDCESLPAKRKQRAVRRIDRTL